MRINFEYFIENNKSGFKTKESHVKNNYLSLYIDIINNISEEYKTISFKEKLWCYFHNLNKPPKCANCDTILNFKKNLASGYGKYCSISCTNKHEDHKKAVIETNIIKYGGAAPICSDKIKDKITATIINTYGVSNIFEDVEYIKNKTLKSKGVTHISKLESTKRNRRETNIIKYGVTTPLLLESVRYKGVIKKNELFLDKYYELNVIESNSDNIIIFCDKCQ